MAKKKAARKRPAQKSSRPKRSKSGARSPDLSPDADHLDAALFVTYAGEASCGIVEYSHAPATQAIQEFAVQVLEVSALPGASALDSGRALDIAREIFEANDQREMPFRRVIGRVLDELLNHRRFTTCSGGDVYYVLLDELEQQLPETHRQRRSPGDSPFNRTLNPGRRIVDNRLRELKGASREDGKGSGPTYVQTTSTTQGGAEQGYRLTEVGGWLFDGWPELPELVRGRSQGPR